jgi:hypothetical protein
MDGYLVFNDKSVIKSHYLNEDIYNFLDKTFEIPSSFKFDIIKVTSQYVARPDLLSYDIYGTDLYVDVICKLNDISNPFELNEGDMIVVPSAADIASFFVKPIILEQNDKENNILKAKQKQEKRKPNSAIVGDKRFTIDTKKRVIIY